MDEHAVEVCGENCAYYKGYVTDVFEDQVLVAFENNWQPESKFPFSLVRLPPNKNTKEEIKEKGEVEVLSCAPEQDVPGWWKATVTMIRGAFFVVDYIGWENTYAEIIPSERIRPKNENPPIDKDTFHRFTIDVPVELREYASVDRAHKEFQKSLGACLVKYVPEKGILVVISRTPLSEKRSSLLKDMHFRSLSQKVLLLKRTEEAARQLESTKLQSIGGFSDGGKMRYDQCAYTVDSKSISSEDHKR